MCFDENLKLVLEDGLKLILILRIQNLIVVDTVKKNDSKIVTETFQGIKWLDGSIVQSNGIKEPINVLCTLGTQFLLSLK